MAWMIIRQINLGNFLFDKNFVKQYIRSLHDEKNLKKFIFMRMQPKILITYNNMRIIRIRIMFLHWRK